MNASENNKIETLVTAGDDYELAFLADKKHADVIRNIEKNTGVKLTRIGTAINGEGVRVLNPNGSEFNLSASQSGFKHF